MNEYEERQYDADRCHELEHDAELGTDHSGMLTAYEETQMFGDE